jgi:hypothetical protein
MFILNAAPQRRVGRHGLFLARDAPDIRVLRVRAVPASRYAHAGYSLPPLQADLPAAQVQIAARACDPLARRANQQKPVQSRAQKYSASPATQINRITPAISSTKGALATSRTRGEMRWT